ncbi:MFS transporter [Sporolactobacillus pectinivorans]|uniref:MFS transporter n=1 Tax=Sporolactobacillus pectinivorans TaxID=1591408 RepID=UPI000C258B4D|nr:MFS transporter [Sporolactobacillus pectinivorans]
MKNKYVPTALGLYINYFVHGMGVIILAQNMDALAKQWNTNIGGVAIVISALGIGRLIVLFVSGVLSDKFGRKPFVYLGLITYISFFIGILISPNIAVAYIFGILAGIANSFLDCGTYPALMESFPVSASTANIMLKAFISGGQFLLPLIISFFVAAHIWFGWSFLIAAIILIANAFYLFKRPFPLMYSAEDASGFEKNETHDHLIGKPKFWLEGICFCLYGYVSQATFYLVSQWLTKYGSSVAGMGDTPSRVLMSYYAIGSIICVFVTAVLVKKFHTIFFLVGYTFVSMAALIILVLFPSPLVCILFSFVIGYSAAGGVMQLALVLMAEVFPRGKGTITGTFYTLGSIASFTIPLITGRLSNTSIASIMIFDAWIAAAGFVLALIIAYRYRKVVRIAATTEVEAS